MTDSDDDPALLEPPTANDFFSLDAVGGESSMRQVVGQILRITGLLIEMIGLLGVITGLSSLDAAPIQLLGGVSVAPVWIPIILGFLIWLIGTILTVGSNPRRL